MRQIERATAFKRDYKQIKTSPLHIEDIDELLVEILNLLVQDKTLPSKCRDHGLIGNWYGYRECHIKPDLLLIYRFKGHDLLHLARLGSHSKLFSR